MGTDGFISYHWWLAIPAACLTDDQRDGIFKLLRSPGVDSLSQYFQTFLEPRNRFQGMNSASLCSLAGLYDNPIPTRFLAPIDCLKIPALAGTTTLFLRGS
jgi:hypothetical protein